MAVDHFAMFLLREERSDLPPGESPWKIGDIVRLAPLLPTESMFLNPGTAQPRKAVLVCKDANLTDQEFLDMQVQLSESDGDLSLRKWTLTFDPADYSDLTPPQRSFMDDLISQLTSQPYGAARDWRDVKQVAIKGKRAAGRPVLPGRAANR